MTYYELINPSDTYTLRADDPKVAIYAALVLGGGMYALSDEQGADVLPIFFGAGVDEWLLEKYGCDLDALQIQVDKSALAACFDSVAICKLSERRLWDMAVEAMDDPVKRQAWLDAWHDKHRSSLNDIGARARVAAARARVLAATVMP